MRKFINKLRLGVATGGFTMIELLVVIAVIGVLAVAVLSSINPVEQINKGRDTRVRSNAAQLLNAVDRFYAIHELYPWNDATYATALTGTDTFPTVLFPDAVVCTDAGTPAGFCQIGGTGYTTGDQDWLDGLTSTDEVKDSFVNQLENIKATNATYVYKAAEAIGVDDSIYICFAPSSKAFQQEALDGCENRGPGGANILPAGACDQAAYPAADYSAELICLP